jgi:hypothetical protein
MKRRYLTCIWAILKNEKFWLVISAMSAAFAAVFSYQAVIITKNAFIEQQNAARPYFVTHSPGIRDNPLQIRFVLENIGIRPALDFEYSLYVVYKGEESKPILQENGSIGDQLPNGDSFTLVIAIDPLPPDDPFKYVILAIKYSDPLTGKSYPQIFNSGWDRLWGEQGDPNFTHISNEEEQLIQEQLYQQLSTYMTE